MEPDLLIASTVSFISEVLIDLGIQANLGQVRPEVKLDYSRINNIIHVS